MNDRRPNRVVRRAAFVAATLAFALPVSAQTQDVQSRVVTHQAATAQSATVSLAEWEARYAEALAAAQQLQSTDRTRALGEHLELDLQAYDEALRAYVRVSERLRHKDRALAESMETLGNAGQTDSRIYQTMSNAMKAAHETVRHSINNIR